MHVPARLTARGDLADHRGELVVAQREAYRLAHEALALARHVGNKHATSWSLFLLGNVVWAQTRDSERALALYQESLSLVRETRDIHHLEYVLLMLGQVAHAQGDYDQAQFRYDQFVALMEERGGIDYRTLDVSPAVIGYARLAVARGKPDRAARLFGAAHTALASPHPDVFIDRCAVDRDIAAVRLDLGELAFADTVAEGRAMTTEQVVAYALDGRALKPSAA